MSYKHQITLNKYTGYLQVVVVVVVRSRIVASPGAVRGGGLEQNLQRIRTRTPLWLLGNDRYWNLRQLRSVLVCKVLVVEARSNGTESIASLRE
jgi:hypothetical protein